MFFRSIVCNELEVIMMDFVGNLIELPSLSLVPALKVAMLSFRFGSGPLIEPTCARFYNRVVP